MSARTVVNVIVAVALLATAYWISGHNQAALEQELVLPFGIPGHADAGRLPVGLALWFAFGLGAAFVALSWTFRRVQAGIEELTARRATRAGREAEATYRRGLEAMVGRRHDRALQLMRETLALQPDHAGALMTGADLLRSLGRATEAVEWRQRRLDSGEDVVALHGLAEDHRARGSLAEAAVALERVVTLRPKRSAAALERLREIHIENESWEKALAAHARWKRLTMADGETTDAGDSDDLVRAGLEVRHATQLADLGKGREAVALLRKVIRKQPRHLPAYLALAEVHELEGREAEALQAWVDGYERTNEAVVLVAAEEHFVALLRQGDPMEAATAALSAFKRFVACSGRRPHAVAFLGKLYVRFEMLDEAAAAFDSVRAEFPDNPTYTYYAARIAEKQGRPAVASAWYRAILKSLDVLRLRYRCSACDAQSPEYVDRCAACKRWGTLGLESGSHGLRESQPAPRPVYAVPDSNGAESEDG